MKIETVYDCEKIHTFPEGTEIYSMRAFPNVCIINTSDGVYELYGNVCKKLNTCV